MSKTAWIVASLVGVAAVGGGIYWLVTRKPSAGSGVVAPSKPAGNQTLATASQVVGLVAQGAGAVKAGAQAASAIEDALDT